MEKTNNNQSASSPKWKRTTDIVLVLFTLPVWLPVAVIMAVVIRLVSKGPVLFRQERVGFSGSRFMCLKFRTMLVGADTAVHQGHLKELMDSDAPMVKMDAKGDSRHHSLWQAVACLRTGRIATIDQCVAGRNEFGGAAPLSAL